MTSGSILIFGGVYKEPRKKSGIGSMYVIILSHRLNVWYIYLHENQVLPVVTLFGGRKVTFSGVVGDLHLGDEKVTWKKLVVDFIY